MSGWYDEPSVILSGGPVRVEVGDPDPEFVPRPVGFARRMRPAQVPGGMRAREAVAAVNQVIAQMKTGMHRIRPLESCIADTDPWTTDAGDQA